MEFSITDDQKQLYDGIVNFSRRELNAGVAERDRTAEFPQELWTKCGEFGMPGLPVPEEYGGSGLDPLTTAIALEGFGYGCEDGGLVFAVGAHLCSCVVPIWKLGNDQQRGKYLEGLSNGSLIGAHAMTEPDSGSDAFAMNTTAFPDGNGYRLNGTKTMITSSPVADLAIVFALTDPDKGYHGGVTAFILEKGTSGLRAGKNIEQIGLRTSALGELVLDDVRVSADAVLGNVGGGGAVFAHSMNWERVCIFASLVGTMQRLLERSVEYARTRRQFGKAIGKFQAVAHRMADMKVRLEAARLLTYQAAWKLERTRSVALDASIAKLFVSESLVQSASDTVQIFGGYGLAAEYGVERILRDAVGSTIYSGTSDMQRNIIARWLGL